MLSVSLGGAAGALIRMAVAFPQNFNGPAPGVMTLAFLTGGPVAIGWVTAAVSHRYGATSIAWRIFLPWLSTLIACAPVWVLNLEGWICIDMGPVHRIGPVEHWRPDRRRGRSRRWEPATGLCALVSGHGCADGITSDPALPASNGGDANCHSRNPGCYLEQH